MMYLEMHPVGSVAGGAAANSSLLEQSFMLYIEINVSVSKGLIFILYYNIVICGSIRVSVGI